MKKIKKTYNDDLSFDDKMHLIYDKVRRKFLISKIFFISFSMLSIVLSALIVVLNLYSIRWNEYPEQTMVYFIAMALITSILTFIISIQSFLNISNRKNKIKENIVKTSELILELEEKTDLSQEDLDNINELLN
ncbi:hypothetical protein BCF59_0320 [Mycoplasmopsis mustelae]|uniref:Uncharacterized protein n=1 Tax=Mycoplasmopsis mustelae TaxID=171289 RepID=A0A4R7UD18_9BACT|nr:hypothetical protein [Mycoplasmopsis mustelae]TDV24358.1 hypothetical protein BCF59_0320 [Mycoplasmopsis mustelae]